MKLELPAGTRFTCQQCGDCCRGWNVPLVAGERERLEGLDWSAGYPPLVDVTPTVSTTTDGRRLDRLARRDDDACIYLGDANACLIQTHFGAATKPHACRMYPFSFRPLGGDRVMVDAAYSCSAVSAGVGDPLTAASVGWTQLKATPKVTGATFPLTRRYRVNGDLLWAIERQLLALLCGRDQSLLDRIRCVLEYLRLATTGDPTTPSAAVLREVMAKAIPGQIAKRQLPLTELDETQRAVFMLWTYLVLNPAPAHIQEWSRRHQAREGERRAAIAEQFRRGDGWPWLDNRELSVTFEQLDTIGTRLFAGDADPILEEFLQAKLIGQRFRYAGNEELPLVDATKRLLLCHPIAIWAAKGLAAVRGARDVGESDLRAALRLVDRSFDQIRTSGLAQNQRGAWEFIVGETDLAVTATHALLRD